MNLFWGLGGFPFGSGSGVGVLSGDEGDSGTDGTLLSIHIAVLELGSPCSTCEVDEDATEDEKDG